MMFLDSASGTSLAEFSTGTSSVIVSNLPSNSISHKTRVSRLIQVLTLVLIFMLTPSLEKNSKKVPVNSTIATIKK